MRIVVIKGMGKGTAFILYDGMNSLGRDVSNRIRLLDPRISRKQCKIRKIARSLFLYDLGGKNGTLVNGEAVNERELKIGDEIAIGNTVLQVVDGDYVPEAAPAYSGHPSFLGSLFSAFLGGWGMSKTRAFEPDYRGPGRKVRKPIWKPPAYTDPPEGRQDTIAANTDPD